MRFSVQQGLAGCSLLALWCATTVVNAGDPVAIASLPRGCSVVSEFPSSVLTWMGECGVDGFATGYGVLVARYHREGQDLVDSYRGDMLNGRYHGQGTYFWSSGSWYAGQWKNGQPDGIGTAFFSRSKFVFRGYWRQGARVGKGTRTDIDGNTCSGSWSDGKLVTPGVGIQGDQIRACTVVEEPSK